MFMFKNCLLFFLLVFSILNSCLAKDYVVKAYTAHEGQDMVFDPAFIQIQKGDRITFEIIDKHAGHNSKSIFTPDKATSWDSPEDQNFTQTFDQEGLYIYQCKTHAIMSMLGIIQVGKAYNLTAARAFIEQNKPQWPINPKRIETYLQKIIP